MHSVHASVLLVYLIPLFVLPGDIMLEAQCKVTQQFVSVSLGVAASISRHKCDYVTLSSAYHAVSQCCVSYIAGIALPLVTLDYVTLSSAYHAVSQCCVSYTAGIALPLVTHPQNKACYQPTCQTARTCFKHL